MENQSVKMFSLPRDVIALAGVSSKNTSRTALNAVHFDGKNAMASDGHRLALVPFDNQDLKGTSLDLGAVKKPKSAYMTFIKTAEAMFLSEGGPAGLVECAQPDYNQIIPTVSPETHHAVALNVELLAGLHKAIDGDNKGDKKGFLTLLISKRDNLDAIGVVSSNSAGIGVLMPCRPFGGAGFPDAFQKFAAISGQNSLEGQIKAVEELTSKVEAGEVALSSDVAAVFNQTGEAADAFKSAEAEGEDVPLDIEGEEETEGGERKPGTMKAQRSLRSQGRTIRAGSPLQGEFPEEETQLVQEDQAEQTDCEPEEMEKYEGDPVTEEAQVA